LQNGNSFFAMDKALESISKYLELILKKPDLRKNKIQQLKETRDFWTKSKKQ
jgi:uncharacterized protein YueI